MRVTPFDLLHIFLLTMFLPVLCVTSSGDARAQNTSGVIGPVVNEGHRSVQYRATYDLDNEKFSNRTHYQQSINDDVSVRLVVQTKKTDDKTFDFEHVQGEILVQLTDNDQPYQSGIRIDVRVRGNDSAKFISLNWAHQYAVTDKISLRGTTLTHVEFGDDRRRGVDLKTRASATYRHNDQFQSGVEFYNAYGYTTDILPWSKQRHQIGGFLNTKLNHGYALFTGALFGVTNATPDQELRVFLSRSF